MNALRRWWLRRRAVKPTLLRLERDDVVVLTARGPLTREQAARIRYEWDKRFPHNTSVVLDGLTVTGVLRTAPVASASERRVSG